MIVDISERYLYAKKVTYCIKKYIHRIYRWVTFLQLVKLLNLKYAKEILKEFERKNKLSFSNISEICGNNNIMASRRIKDMLNLVLIDKSVNLDRSTEYTLTTKGKELQIILESLMKLEKS